MSPVKVSGNRRYFVDEKGKPVFWLGTTQWQLFREYTLEEAEAIIAAGARTGFAYAQVMLLGVGDGAAPNRYGQKPMTGDDPLSPNEEYFRHVDSVVKIAAANGLIISMTMYHQRYRPFITSEKAGAWAKWIAARYREAPNIVWSMTPEAKNEFIPVVRNLAAGLREGDGGRHLITFKPDPAPHEPGFLHDEEWLDFSSMQVWKWIESIYPMVTTEYSLEPTKPVLMGEGAYEEGSEYGFEVTPLWVRRQAYYSYLSGAHHTYGHNDSWRVLPTWRKALEAPGAAQLGLLKKIFLARREWWNLLPDQGILAGGGETEGQLLTLGARHKDGLWGLVYAASEAAFAVDMKKFSSPRVEAFWVDPRNAGTVAAGSIEGQARASFSTPSGWEDALLVLEAAD